MATVAAPKGFEVIVRPPAPPPGRSFEKVVIVPERGDQDTKKHAWADARFWTDIMAEHALFFAILMPPELAPKERDHALAFNEKFTKLHERVANAEVPASKRDVENFVTDITKQMEPFIEYKKEQHERQRSGELRSLVWPLFFDHTRREAQRFVYRLEKLAEDDLALKRSEVVAFWCGIMDEHARFIAHLLDPDETELRDKALKTSAHFQELRESGGALRTRAETPQGAAEYLVGMPDMDAIARAAQAVLDFKTEAARGIEAGRIQSIIEPRLADHVRREAAKFRDELKRAE